MNLKWLFGTGILATIVFFSAIYFGMKYNWVSESNPSANRKNSAALDIRTSQLQPKTHRDNTNAPSAELVDEEFIPSSEDQSTLIPSDLTIEQVVAQCQRLSESIGVPDSKLEQAITECVDRNSSHLSNQEPLGERDTLVREQCIIAVSQSELLSHEEIKMLVDECVASMTSG